MTLQGHRSVTRSSEANHDVDPRTAAANQVTCLARSPRKVAVKRARELVGKTLARRALTPWRVALTLGTSVSMGALTPAEASSGGLVEGVSINSVPVSSPHSVQAAGYQRNSLAGDTTASSATSAEFTAAEPTGATETHVDTAASDSSTGDSNADTLPETGFEWGMKLGVELPFGQTDGAGVSVRGIEYRSGDLGGVALLNVPIALDLGYRTSRSWWWGLEVGAGLGPTGDDCPDDTLCDFNNLRLSAQVIYNISPDSSVQPWVGALLGYEWLRPSVTQVVTVPSNDGGEQQVPIGAKEFLGGPQLGLEGGLQFSLADHVRLGPFMSAAMGAYLTDSFECASSLSCPDRDTVDGVRIHGWLGLGVRGTHGP